MRRLSFIRLCVLFLYIHLWHVSATCFYPNGDTASDAFPCGGDSSVCCASKFQCLSNGLCNDYRYQNWQRVLRGSCTDKGGAGCPTVCTSVWPQGDAAVYYCGNGKYCCDGQDCCSQSSKTKVDLGTPSVTATALSGNVANAKPTSQQEQPKQQQSKQDNNQQAQTSAPQQTPEATQEAPQKNDQSSPTPAPATSSSSPSSASEEVSEQSVKSSPPSSVQQTLGASVIIIQSTINPTAPPQASTVPSSNPTSKGGGVNSVAIGVGVGVGVAVLIFLVLFAVFFYVQGNKARALKGASRGSMDEQRVLGNPSELHSGRQSRSQRDFKPFFAEQTPVELSDSHWVPVELDASGGAKSELDGGRKNSRRVDEIDGTEAYGYNEERKYRSR